MAQSGYTPVSLYYSTTASAVPVDTNLVAGELALNTLDEKLYFKNSTGTVKLLASVAGATGTVSSVAATVPGFLSVSGSPITTSGTLAITYSGTALPVANGGTGITTIPTNGQIPIGNGTNYTAATLTAGSGVSISNSSGAITITATGSGGTVTSVAASVPAFLSIAGSPITTSGTLAITYSGTALPVANGGTGLTSGTSGGVLYYSATGTLASSAALTQYGVVYGGGAGATPVATANGTTGQAFIATTSAAPSWGTLGIAGGGTGLTSTPANGALDIGNGTGFTRTTLTAGTGITVTNASGAITIASSGGSGTAIGLVRAISINCILP